MTRSESIRKFCKACNGDNEHSAKDCELRECSLYRFRMTREDPTAPGKRVTRGKAVRAFCLDCMGDSPKAVNECPSVSTCVLYPYRMGRNPSQVGT